ncbi:hypothetical protein KEM55_007803 [Ascosphaera atra]|nr:hypothetical protein KEM55_007803 [Ascosphaera atra]
MSQLPPVDTLPALTRAEQCATLDLLFEPSEALHNLVLPMVAQKNYPSYPALIADVGNRIALLLRDKEYGRLNEILGSHPRLGEKKANVSELSRREQESLRAAEACGSGDAALEDPQGYDQQRCQRLQHEVAIENELQRWNAMYEARFPGLKFVCFVNGRPREAVIQELQQRYYRNDLQCERSEVISALCLIALDRAKKLQCGG